VVVGEFITSQAGLGYLIMFAASRAESPIIFAAIAVLCTIGLLFFGVIFYPLLAFGGAEYQWGWQRGSSDGRAARDGTKPWKPRGDGDSKPWKNKAKCDDNW